MERKISTTAEINRKKFFNVQSSPTDKNGHSPNQINKRVMGELDGSVLQHLLPCLTILQEGPILSVQHPHVSSQLSVALVQWFLTCGVLNP